MTLSLFIICNAKETSWDFLPKLAGKFVFVTNDEQQMAGLKKAKVAIEKLKKPTAEQMTKALFLEHEWPVEKAKRLSQLAEGDWRRVWVLEQLFRDASIDLATASDDDFQEALATMTKDNVLDVHPTLKVHQLFSGAGAKQRLENYTDTETLAWGEANLGVVCGTVGDMLTMAESAVTCDVLMSAAEDDGLARSLGLDHFARSARSIAGDGLGYYDYRRFSNPYAKDAESVGLIKDSYDKTRSSNWHWKRMPQEEGGVEEIGECPPKTKRPRAASKAKAKAGAKPKVGAETKRKAVTKQ